MRKQVSAKNAKGFPKRSVLAAKKHATWCLFWKQFHCMRQQNSLS